MNPSNSDTGNPVLLAYVSAIRTNFAHEPFDQIEEYLERAWTQCRVESDPAWPDIREQVRGHWSGCASTQPDPVPS